MTDVIGVLQAYDGTTAVVVRRDGTPVSLSVADVVAAKSVPPPSGLRIGAEELQRICAAGWPAPVAEPLGEWTLRAAGGFTGRANSALVAGEPGVPAVEALARVTRFYRRRDLPPRAQVVTETAWDERFAEAGWRPLGGAGGGALVMAAGLRTPLADAASPSVELSAGVDDAWMSLYNRAGGHDPALVRALLAAPSDVAFARIGDPPQAIGRMVVTDGWAGLAAVEVVPSMRRRGLASAVVDALVGWALGRGARWCYLQVTADNEAALSRWRRYGFREHHSYRYLVPPL